MCSNAIDEGCRRLARALVVKENPRASRWPSPPTARSYGPRADIEGHELVTPRTRFRLGAGSKPLTGAAVALLHDRGRLDLDAPVQTYVRDHPQKQWPPTARQVLGDVAGVHRVRGDDNDAMPFEQCANLGEALPLFADVRDYDCIADLDAASRGEIGTNPGFQKMNFNPNCICRGVLTVVLILPKSALPRLTFGRP